MPEGYREEEFDFNQVDFDKISEATRLRNESNQNIYFKSWDRVLVSDASRSYVLEDWVVSRFDSNLSPDLIVIAEWKYDSYIFTEDWKVEASDENYWVNVKAYDPKTKKTVYIRNRWLCKYDSIEEREMFLAGREEIKKMILEALG